MNEDTQTYNVSIINYTAYKPYGIPYPCGKKNKQEIEDCIGQIKQEINDCTSMPEDSCICKFEATFKTSQTSSVCLNKTTKDNVQKQSGDFLIEVIVRQDCKCGCAEDCLENLARGRCKDAIVRKLIGEKLFKDKYTNQQ